MDTAAGAEYVHMPAYRVSPWLIGIFDRYSLAAIMSIPHKSTLVGETTPTVHVLQYLLAVTETVAQKPPVNVLYTVNLACKAPELVEGAGAPGGCPLGAGTGALDLTGPE